MEYRDWVKSRLKDLPVELLLNLPEVCLGCEHVFLLPTWDFTEEGIPACAKFVLVDSEFILSIRSSILAFSLIPTYIYRENPEINIQIRLFDFSQMDDYYCKQLKLFWFNDLRIEIAEISEVEGSFYFWFCTQARVCFIIEQSYIYRADSTDQLIRVILRSGICLMADNLSRLLGLPLNY